MHDIRLIAMDLDGTLLNSRQQVSEGNRKALLAARAKGVHLAICSGRCACDIAGIAMESGLDDCALLSLNGLHCYDHFGGELFSDHLFSWETSRQIIDVLWKTEIVFACFLHNTVVAFHDEEKKVWHAHEDNPMKPRMLHRSECRLDDIDAPGINKIVCITPDAKLLSSVRAQLEQIDGVGITSSWFDNLELIPSGFGKGTGVAEMAKRLGLDASQVMTFGDNDNDLSMIQWAGMGVAMENATENVKQAAKFITLNHNEDGVAYAIRCFVLGEE